MAEAREELSFEELFDRMNQLIDEVEQSQDSLRDTALELLDHLEVWHREGIIRLATSVASETLESARQDPFVASLLDAYLSEEDDTEDPMALVDEALAEVRPYLHSHGGEMEVVDVSHGIVTLRLMGACDGCPSSTVTLTQGVEQVLREQWAGFRGLRVEGDPEHAQEHGHQQPQDQGPQLLQIQSLKRD